MKNIISKLIKDNRGASGLRKFTIAFIFVIAFAFLLITFISQFLVITNPTSDLLTNQAYGLNASATSFNNTMNNFASTVNNTQTTLQGADTSKVGTFLFLIFEGALTIPKALLGFVGSGVGSLSGMFLAMEGKNPIFAVLIPLIMAGITVTFVFLIVKAIRTGESEY